MLPLSVNFHDVETLRATSLLSKIGAFGYYFRNRPLKYYFVI